MVSYSKIHNKPTSSFEIFELRMYHLATPFPHFHPGLWLAGPPISPCEGRVPGDLGRFGGALGIQQRRIAALHGASHREPTLAGCWVGCKLNIDK